MKEAVTKVIDTLIQEDFHGAFKKLLERHNKCPYEKSLETYLMILVFTSCGVRPAVCGSLSGLNLL